MGLRGPLSPDASAELIKHGNTEVIVPAAPIKDMVPAVQAEWEDFWSSKVSRYTDDVDMGSLRRLFAYRNEWYVLFEAWGAKIADPDDDLTVEGSVNAGAVRMHPYAARLDKLEALMLPLEDRFGLSPLSRARLGIEVGSAHLTWQQVQRSQQIGAELSSATPAGLPVSDAEVVTDGDED